MQGHIRKRQNKKGATVYDIVLYTGRDPATGKKKYRWKRGFLLKKDADREMRKLINSLEDSTYVEPTKLTVAQWLRKWYETYVKVHTTLKTQESYLQNIEKHLIPALGAVPLSKLRPQHIQNYYAEALVSGRRDNTGGLSKRTVRYHHSILYKALGHAVKMGVLAINAAAATDPPKVKRDSKTSKLNIWTPEEVNAYLGAAHDSLHYDLFYTILYTGLRLGESLAARWQGLNLDTAELRVEETAHQLDDGTSIIKEPKTDNSKRSIDLTPSNALILRRRKMAMEDLYSSMEQPLTPDDFIFTGIDFSPLTQNAVRQAHRKAVKRAGVHYITIHDMRHTHVSLMLAAKVPIKVISERLGHADPGFTLRVYGHLLPGMQKEAARDFDKIMLGELASTFGRD